MNNVLDGYFDRVHEILHYHKLGFFACEISEFFNIPIIVVVKIIKRGENL